MLSAVSTLTAFQELKPGDNSYGATVATAATNDAAQVGGGVSNAAGAYKAFSASIFQTPKTTGWGIAFRCIVPTPVAAKFVGFGLVNAAANHDVTFASYNTISTTNYVIDITGGATTTVDSGVAINTAMADYVLTCDATTLKLFRNGALVTSTTTLTNLADEPMFPALFGTDVNTAKLVRILYGYIAP